MMPSNESHSMDPETVTYPPFSSGMNGQSIAHEKGTEDTHRVAQLLTDNTAATINSASASSPNLHSVQMHQANTIMDEAEEGKDRLLWNRGSNQDELRDIIFATDSSRVISSSITHTNGIQWHIRPKTSLKESMLKAESNQHRLNNDNISAPIINTYQNGTHTHDQFLPAVNELVNTDSGNQRPKSPRRKSMLVIKSDLPKSPEVEEIKSVKFQASEDSSRTNWIGILTKKNQVSPISYSTIETDKFSSPSVTSVSVSDRCFGSLRRGHRQVSEPSVSREQNDTSSDIQSPTAVRTGLFRCANLSTQRGRRNHALLIMLVSVVPVVALLIQNSIDLSFISSELDLHKSVKGRILFSVETGQVIHRTQIERGITALYVSSGGDAQIKDILLEAYENTDKEIHQLNLWVVEPNITHLRSAVAYHDWINNFRNQVLSGSVPNVTVSEVIRFYSDDNAIITRWVGNSIQQSKSGDLWKTLVGYYMLILSKEQAGVERALGSTFYAQGGFNKNETLDYMQRKILGVTYLDRCKDYSARVKNFLMANFVGKELDLNLQLMRGEILLNVLNGSDVHMGSLWFWNMTEYIDILMTIQNTLAEDILEGLQKEVDDLTHGLLETICVIVVALVLFPVVILAVYRLTNRIQDFAQTLQERTRDLDIERKRSETLLFELLPVSVAKKLLNHEEVPPVSYPAVTIFFSDIVGFTTICGKSSPMQVIDMLNSLYRLFDDIIDSYDVYKVETIGDAYMVVSGLPQQNSQCHATEMANFALDIRKTISHMTVQHLPGQSLQMRIGLNSGSVVAGVVGQKMPRYCLFGDTVTVASRMESTSLPLHIQISESCRRGLEKAGGFIIRERGTFEVKGKGKMTTYWLDDRINLADDES